MLVVDGLPPIDLAQQMRQPGLRYDASLGGYPRVAVQRFEAPRHGNGQRRPNTFSAGVALREYLTPAPLGRGEFRALSAPTAVPRASTTPSPATTVRARRRRVRHSRRSAFEDKNSLRVYLMSLRRLPAGDRSLIAVALFFPRRNT